MEYESITMEKDLAVISRIDSLKSKRVRDLKVTLIMFFTVFTTIIGWLPWPLIMQEIRKHDNVVYLHFVKIWFTGIALCAMVCIVKI